MQKITLTFTSPEGIVSQQVVSKPKKGEASQASVPPGVKVLVELQATATRAGQAKVNKKGQLVLQQRENDLIVLDGKEELLELTDFFQVPGAVLDESIWSTEGASPVLWASGAAADSGLADPASRVASDTAGKSDPDRGGSTPASEGTSAPSGAAAMTPAIALLPGFTGPALAAAAIVGGAALVGRGTASEPVRFTVTDNTEGTAHGPVIYTLTFTHPVQGLALAKLSLTGGTLSNFQASADGKTYTVTATPALTGTGSMQLSVNLTGVSNPEGRTIEASSVPAQDFSQNIVEGTIVAGPVVDGHQLSVGLFKPDGTVLAKTQANSMGHYKASVGTYTGTVVALVIDGAAGTDYMDASRHQGVGAVADDRRSRCPHRGPAQGRPDAAATQL